MAHLTRRMAAGFVCLAVPAFAAAQSTYTYSYAYQHADLPNQYQTVVPSGCFDAAATSGAAASGIGSCTFAGGAVASAQSSFDPATGKFKTGATLSGNGQTLSQFVPTYDAGGNRVYTGAARPDAIGVYSTVLLSDYFQLNATPGAAPATISFFLDIDGMIDAPWQLSGANAFTSNFVNFCSAAQGICGTDPSQAFYGGSYHSLHSMSGGGFLQQSFAPAGSSVTPSISFSGTQSLNAVNGRLTLDNIPVVSGSPFDFVFAFGSEAAFYHPSANVGQIPAGCDPALDPSCIVLDPTDVWGDVYADYTHTLTFAGYQVRDANGTDITSQVRLTFASGLQPNVTATPEPATLALLGAGLTVLGLVGRARRRA